MARLGAGRAVIGAFLTARPARRHSMAVRHQVQAPEIATVEDMVRVLDEHPQWLEALRARLLTRELLDLPQTVADFIAATDRRFAEVDRRFDVLERQMVELRADLERQLFELRADLERHLLEQRADLERQLFEQRNDLQREMNQLRADIGPLKAAHARNAAMEEAGMIAEDLGLSLVGILSRDDLRSLAQRADAGDVSKHDLRSFRRADMVLRATDAAGTECYLAVEVSYTANGRDTERAVRNAQLLTRFTGLRASAVVVSLRLDNRIRPAVDSGEVAWYQLDAEDLEVD